MAGQSLMVETAGGENLTLTLSSVTPVSSPLPLQAMPPNDYVRYPPPLATYDQVLASQTLFKQTLQKLHADMQTKFMIPIVGGQFLDLHRLFALVTYRGGFCKVYQEKKWTEVHGSFRFPLSATNSSYIVRKYYFSLLLQYERVYFQRAESWSPTELEAMRVWAFPKKHRQRNGAGESSSSRKAAQKRPAISEPEVAASPVEIPTPTVLGTIESKFDVGYYITGKMGSETMHGVLYHIPPNPAPPSQAAEPQPLPQQSVASAAPSSAATESQPQPKQPVASAATSSAAAEPQLQPQQPVASAATSSAAAGKKTRRKRRKKSEMKIRDPSKSKAKNRSGYNIFFSAEHYRLRDKYRGIKGGHQMISIEIGANWRKLSDDEKAVYKEQAKAQRLKALEEKKLKLGQTTGEPILQLTAKATSSSQYEEANVELSLGQSMPMQPAQTMQQTFRPDLNVIDLDDAAEGSGSMETRADGHHSGGA